MKITNLSNNKRAWWAVGSFCAIVLILALDHKQTSQLPALPIAFVSLVDLKFPEDASLKSQIIALAGADPVADARVAFKRGDFRPIGVFSYAPVIPPSEKRATNAKMIAFTSDVQRSLEDEKLSWLAYHYAVNYNKALQQLHSE